MRRFKREKSVMILVHPDFLKKLDSSRVAYSNRSGVYVNTNTSFTGMIAKSNLNLIPPLKGGILNDSSKKRRRF